eukprot:5997087-Ditylum_brightwellii.AAC.1
MDASDTQLGAIISQQGMPVAFYSRKLNSAQRNYTTMEQELLAIAELGQQIKVYTDHKNLMYKNFNTARVIRWRMILEDYAPELIYIPGNTNVVVDSLSCLGKDNGSQLPSSKTSYSY